jgi:hypothetical protein
MPRPEFTPGPRTLRAAVVFCLLYARHILLVIFTIVLPLFCFISVVTVDGGPAFVLQIGWKHTITEFIIFAWFAGDFPRLDGPGLHKHCVRRCPSMLISCHDSIGLLRPGNPNLQQKQQSSP